MDEHIKRHRDRQRATTAETLAREFVKRAMGELVLTIGEQSRLIGDGQPVDMEAVSRDFLALERASRRHAAAVERLSHAAPTEGEQEAVG